MPTGLVYATFLFGMVVKSIKANALDHCCPGGVAWANTGLYFLSYVSTISDPIKEKYSLPLIFFNP